MWAGSSDRTRKSAVLAALFAGCRRKEGGHIAGPRMNLSTRSCLVTVPLLTPTQRAAIAVDALPMFEQEAKKRLATSTGGNAPRPTEKIPEADQGESREHALPMFEQEAKKRQQEHGQTAPGKPKTVPEKIPEVMGEAREQEAKKRMEVRKGNQPGASTEKIPDLDQGKASEHAAKKRMEKGRPQKGTEKIPEDTGESREHAARMRPEIAVCASFPVDPCSGIHLVSIALE